ncbi:glycoside hydrolase [Mangrovimicrobium sediminis]|uniref:Glycoside hydrolase n=1 Tax=Mangrovimicrobium sediminis TaxID=2562682 RepID=A0A4Z0LW57_9GAMM|nr:glycoside hydrolase [Haliea sp. SAOS-164]TGD71499.1 glycoside hydrolase [Haliea sp. SAOS-164]
MPSDAAAPAPMRVMLCWHMHQPEYRNLRSGKIHLPWTYLHSIKDYVDMAAHIEAVPGARAVVNFAPILLEQIQFYVDQLHQFFDDGGSLGDPLLAALAEPVLPSDRAAQLELVKACLRANRERMIDRFAPFARLAGLAQHYIEHPEGLIYASSQFLADLLVWYHLSWMGESVRREDPRITALEDKGGNYSIHDRRELAHIVLELMESIVPRYRALAEAGKVELIMSPYAHPIVPLLLDMESAREAMPDAPLPLHTEYPGGAERADWHLEHGLKVFERFFGQRPVGLWPSEGGVSQAALAHFADAGFQWIASGEGVLNNSLSQTTDHGCKHRLYRFGDVSLHCVFRDDGLSDLIGFNYSEWHGEDAVANLVGHMEHIAELCKDHKDCLISVILDGENAWEYYPENGYHFLSHLYQKLAEHPRLQLTTMRDFLAECDPEPRPEERLTAGSWVYGSFSTWIGSAEKNRGWDLLVEAKHCYDQVMATGKLPDHDRALAEQQMAICEGSDWFWWFGDYNPSDSVSLFDQLYREQLANLYHCLHVEAPASLAEVISRGGGAHSRGGVMRHHDEQHH